VSPVRLYIADPVTHGDNSVRSLTRLVRCLHMIDADMYDCVTLLVM
jgi:hypothetical protein